MNSRGETVVALLSRSLCMDYLAPAVQGAFAKVGESVELRFVDTVRGTDALHDGAQVDVALCWEPKPGNWPLMPNVRLVHSVAAGVDHILEDPTLPADVPLARIRDPHMASAMAAYVTWAVTSGHRGMDRYAAQQRTQTWIEHAVQPATQYPIGIAGMGTLGSHCARALAAIGYPVRGWSRSVPIKPVAGCEHFVGDAQRGDFLHGLKALICLLPLTDQTRGALNADCFAQLAEGAHVINVGRGAHLIEGDLLAALDSGQLGLATLDAFNVEPLPANDPLWTHPKVRVTPHIATRTAPQVIADQLVRHWLQVRAGETPQHAVDRANGY